MPYLAHIVTCNQTNLWIDPIDTLQTLYDEWYEQNFTFVHGDINQDDIVDILDILNIINIVGITNIINISNMITIVNI